MDSSAAEMTVPACRPARLFLDTNHLINIERLRSGAQRTRTSKYDDAYLKLNARLSTGAVAFMFHLHAPLEWIDGKATEQSARDIAQVVDSFPLQYQCDLDQFIWIREVLDECKRMTPALQVPDFPVLRFRNNRGLRPNIFVILNRCVPGFFADAAFPEIGHTAQFIAQIETSHECVPFESAGECVERALNLKSKWPDTYRERVAGYRAAFEVDRREFECRRSQSITEDDKANWLRNYLRVDRILSALNPGIEIDSLLDEVDISRCPATDLFLRMRERRLRDRQCGVKDSDVGDWSYVPILTYADVALIERNLRHFVRQANEQLATRVTADPSEAAAMIENLLNGNADLTDFDMTES